VRARIAEAAVCTALPLGWMVGVAWLSCSSYEEVRNVKGGRKEHRYRREGHQERRRGDAKAMCPCEGPGRSPMKLVEHGGIRIRRRWQRRFPADRFGYRLRGVNN
jgi:hypothetical protein